MVGACALHFCCIGTAAHRRRVTRTFLCMLMRERICNARTHVGSHGSKHKNTRFLRQTPKTADGKPGSSTKGKGKGGKKEADSSTPVVSKKRPAGGEEEAETEEQDAAANAENSPSVSDVERSSEAAGEEDGEDEIISATKKGDKENTKAAGNNKSAARYEIYIALGSISSQSYARTQASLVWAVFVHASTYSPRAYVCICAPLMCAQLCARMLMLTQRTRTQARTLNTHAIAHPRRTHARTHAPFTRMHMLTQSTLPWRAQQRQGRGEEQAGGLLVLQEGGVEDRPRCRRGYDRVRDAAHGHRHRATCGCCRGRLRVGGASNGVRALEARTCITPFPIFLGLLRIGVKRRALFDVSPTSTFLS